MQNNIIKGFLSLSDSLNQFLNNKETKYTDILNTTIHKASAANAWFTETNIRYALQETANLLTEKKLNTWLNKYAQSYAKNAKKIAVITAGNIPLVGFHDFLSVLITGHTFVGKLSSKDNILLPAIAQILSDIEPMFNARIIFTDFAIKSAAAYIATGSNNSARYFEYYFKKYPHILRKNKNSVAVLSKNTSDEELKHLAHDVFMYFGLGCRNVTSILLPDNFDINRLFNAFYNDYKFLQTHHNYMNNYDYNLAVLQLKQIPILVNGFVILREYPEVYSPISMVNYHYYHSNEDVQNFLKANNEKIQCITGNINNIDNLIELGNTQKPELWDYADNIDTIDFLMSI